MKVKFLALLVLCASPILLAAPATAQTGQQQPRALNPQPIPPGKTNAINPQPLPPGNPNALNPQPLPPSNPNEMKSKRKKKVAKKQMHTEIIVRWYSARA